MLELAEESGAAPARLPTADVPAPQSWILQTAWEVPQSTVQSQLINVWNGCPANYLWADQLCMGGAGFLQACAEDKGACCSWHGGAPAPAACAACFRSSAAAALPQATPDVAAAPRPPAVLPLQAPPSWWATCRWA